MTAVGIADRTVIVAGGTGFVGRLIVADLLARGATVVVPSRSGPRLAAWSPPGPAAGRLITVLIDERAGPRGQAEAVAATGVRPQAVIAALGGWRTGPDLLDTPIEDWDQVLATNLTAHLAALQAYAPLIAGAFDPVYVTLNGAAAELPIPHAGPICVAGAGQRMLLDVMRVGQLGDRVRFHELSLLAAVAGDDRNLVPESEVHPDQIGAAVAAILGDPDSDPHIRVAGR